MGRLEKHGVDIRRLRYFVAVCDHGGFSKAAPVIGIAQPALTRQGQLPEHELGIELFTRAKDIRAARKAVFRMPATACPYRVLLTTSRLCSFPRSADPARLCANHP